MLNGSLSIVCTLFAVWASLNINPPCVVEGQSQSVECCLGLSAPAGWYTSYTGETRPLTEQGFGNVALVDFNEECEVHRVTPILQMNGSEMHCTDDGRTVNSTSVTLHVITGCKCIHYI